MLPAVAWPQAWEAVRGEGEAEDRGGRAGTAINIELQAPT